MTPRQPGHCNIQDPSLSSFTNGVTIIIITIIIIMSWMLSTTSLLRPTTAEWLERVCQRLLDNHPAFQTLELIHPRLDDRDANTLAVALRENVTLTTLVVSCYGLVDDGTAALASSIRIHPTLRKLQLRDLHNAREITTWVRDLARNPTITDVSLRHATICPRSATAVAQYLKDNPVLQELRITDSQFMGNAFSILCEEGLYRHPSIQRVYFVNDDLNDTSGEYVAKILDENCTLQELYLGENNLGDEGVASIVKKMIQNNAVTAIWHLDLRSNNITSTGAMSLQGLIIHHATLRSLELSDNEIGDSGLMALSRGLQQTTHRPLLHRLNVQSNLITNDSGPTIAAMLRSNRSLQELNLSFNSLGDDGVAIIVSALTTTATTNTTTTHHHHHHQRENTTLHTLSLRRNGITNVGAQGIGAALPNMKGLKELLLSKNDIDGLGVKAILHGLRSNVEIEYIDVDYHTKQQVPSTNIATSIASSSSLWLQREMVRCMKLNKAGRRIFRSTVPRSLWPLLFGRMTTDVDLVRDITILLF